MRRVIVWLVAVALIAISGAAHAEIVVSIDKSAQRMTVKLNGQPLYNWPVSTGRSGYGTPSGSFTAFRMEADHRSEEWDDAPMPHSIFFTKFGHAIHGSFDTKNIGRPASHGCVRLSPANAVTLFALVEREGVLKTKVVLTGSEQIALGRYGGGSLQTREVQEARPPSYLNPNAQNSERDYALRQYMNPNYGYARPQYVQPQYPQYRQQFYGYTRGYGVD
jgi:hypothetical protein